MDYTFCHDMYTRLHTDTVVHVQYVDDPEKVR